jgi:hypothetical protein
MACGEWEVRISGLGFVPGYWSEPRLAAGMAALVRGHDTWMSLTPFEYESQEIGIRFARGHVLICGLGMGWAAAACAALPAVLAVTVVEKDPAVIALNASLDPFAQLPDTARAKLRLIEADAFDYVPDFAVDLLMPDIWLPLVADDRFDEVRRMPASAMASAIYFWGQEMELARRAVAAGRALDAAGIAATVAETGLPLIGATYPGYADKVAAAARRWMRDRWLYGAASPGQAEAGKAQDICPIR